MGRFKLSGYDAIVAIFAVAALVDVALPIITTIALISIIGIPIAIMLMVLPAVALVLVLGRLLQKAVGLPGTGPAILSIVAVLLAGAALASHYNGRLAKQEAALVAGDVDALQPTVANTIGLGGAEFEWRDKKKTACNDLCLRLLLNNPARKVVVFDAPKQSNEIFPDAPGISFWLEQRAECPAVVFQDGYERLPDDGKASPTAAEVMARKLATGTCLLSGTANVDAVDTLALTGNVARGNSECSAGFDPGADTVSANRASIYQRGNAGLNETYRKTATLVRPHSWIIAPTIVGCYGLEMRAALYRTSVVRNTGSNYFSDAKLSDLLLNTLKLSLAVPQSAPDAADAPATIITRALEGNGAISGSVHRVVEDFFESFRDRKPAAAEKALALRALEDPRIATPRATWALARAMQTDNAETNARLATILFDRLARSQPEATEDHPTYLGWIVSYADNAIRQMPDDAIRPHKADVEALAHDTARRVRAPNTLERLALFRRDGLPTMLYLVEDAARIHASQEDGYDNDKWQVPLRAGLINLCTLGPDAASAIPQVTTWLQSGERPLSHYSRGLVTITLLSMGASDDQVIQVIGGLQSDTEKSNFKVWKSSVVRGKPDCT